MQNTIEIKRNGMRYLGRGRSLKEWRGVGGQKGGKKEKRGQI